MKRQIHIDRNIPDKAAIERHKDFNGLIKKHQAITKKPRYNAIKIITGLLVIAVIAFLVVEAIDSEERAIAPPLGVEYVPVEYQIIDPNEEATVNLISGTKIYFPAKALQNSDGTICTDYVCIQVSEFRNPVDFFLSGIPMNYDSAGTSYTFESAGMIDIKAWTYNGKVSIAEGKSARVSMPSNNSDRFNIYQFDTVENKWNYESNDEVNEWSPDEAIANAEPTGMPSEVYSSDNVVISRYGEIPDSMSEAEALKAGYMVADTLYFDDSTAAMGYSTERPKTDWKEEAKKKREKLAAIANERRAAQREMLKSYKARDKAFKALLRKNDSLAIEYEKVADVHVKVVREFEIKAFGIWNCDNPISQEFPDYVLAAFQMDEKTVTPVHYYYFVDLSKNALFKYYLGVQSISCDLQTDNVLWYVHSENELAIVNKDEFKLAAKEQRPFRVQLYSIDDGLENLRSTMKEIEF